MSSGFDGFVLGGGASVRMGTDKARVAWQGRPMALVVAEVLGTSCARVALVRRQPAGEDWPIEVVVDAAHDGTHPLFGVAAALVSARTELVVVAPCDVPQLRSEDVASLLALGAPAVAFDGEGLHPLVAVYPRAWAAAALDAARRGRSVRSFAAAAAPVHIAAEYLVNVNTPDALGRSPGS